MDNNQKEAPLTLGKQLNILRKTAKLTQKALSDKLNIDQGYLSEIENDKAVPSTTLLINIAKALNTRSGPLIELLEGSSGDGTSTNAEKTPEKEKLGMIQAIHDSSYLEPDDKQIFIDLIERMFENVEYRKQKKKGTGPVPDTSPNT